MEDGFLGQKSRICEKLLEVDVAFEGVACDPVSGVAIYGARKEQGGAEPEINESGVAINEIDIDF